MTVNCAAHKHEDDGSSDGGQKTKTTSYNTTIRSLSQQASFFGAAQQLLIYCTFFWIRGEEKTTTTYAPRRAFPHCLLYLILVSILFAQAAWAYIDYRILFRVHWTPAPPRPRSSRPPPALPPALHCHDKHTVSATKAAARPSAFDACFRLRLRPDALPTPTTLSIDTCFRIRLRPKST